MTTHTEQFPHQTDGLPPTRRPEAIELHDGDRYTLRMAPVAKRIGDATVRMLAYNGSIPGPTLRVREGSEVEVEVVNDGDHENTVHWHGLRLDNASDGTHETQAPIPVGGRFSCRVAFPDPGVYWYHPHIREDYGQELGLYGTVIVEPADPEYWPACHREVALTLDDILIEDGRISPFGRSQTTHAAMGRFGNVLLVAGEPDLQLEAQHGEVVRLYLTNTANTRVFKVALPGARMKVVGGDSGRVEREELAEEIVLAPSERVIVDVLFDTPGELTLEHRTPEKTYALATIAVTEQSASPPLAAEFGVLRIDPELSAERARLLPLLDAKPDKTLAFVAEMDMGEPDPGDGPVVYACPMHPDVVKEEPGKCPKCGMKLLAAAPPAGYACPMHPDVTSENADRCPKCGMKLIAARLIAGAGMAHGHHDMQSGRDEAVHAGHDHATRAGHDHATHAGHDHATHAGHDHSTHTGHDYTTHAGGIEWEDDMVAVNRTTTPSNTRWKIIDPATGGYPDWRFTVGDRVKIRLVNEMDSDHPMHHPFHIHGAGRFLVMARNGIVEPNLVWSDTVLVRTGEVVDILLEVTNQGRWMAHCHIAEHHESGMMFSFEVKE